MFKRFLPLIIFVILAGFLWVGLQHDPRKIPSPLIGRSLPAFQLSTMLVPDAKADQSIFHGKITLLNVFASWCMSCRAEHPILMDLANQRRVQMIGLDYKDDIQKTKAWFVENGNPFDTVLLDPQGQFAINLGVYGTPETFLIDKKGVIRYKYIGAISPAILQEKIIPEIQSLAAL